MASIKKRYLTVWIDNGDLLKKWIAFTILVLVGSSLCAGPSCKIHLF